MERLSPKTTSQQALADLVRDFSHCSSAAGLTSAGVIPLPGDAGFRRYFRFSDCAGILGVDAPPANEDLGAFLQVQHLLEGIGVRVPKVVVADVKAGHMLVQDFGDDLYQDVLSPDNAGALYNRALETLARLAACENKPHWLPDYTSKKLRQELDLFVDWFLQLLLGIELQDSEQQMLKQLFHYLIDDALMQPQVLVHRDFHCRNLLVVDDDLPAVIDFQDAVWGPVSYDFVSLARDCYVRWQSPRVDEIARDFAHQLGVAGILDERSVRRFPHWVDTMGAQRHIKVLGIFSRLYLRDGKARYLEDLPLVLRYVIEAAHQVPSMRLFGDWMEERVVPVAAKADWYRDWRVAGDEKTLW
jgi:N-acetylmuramate 1-kinase